VPKQIMCFLYQVSIFFADSEHSCFISMLIRFYIFVSQIYSNILKNRFLQHFQSALFKHFNEDEVLADNVSVNIYIYIYIYTYVNGEQSGLYSSCIFLTNSVMNIFRSGARRLQVSITSFCLISRPVPYSAMHWLVIKLHANTLIPQ